ncbi:hypothetical protein [Parasediminibacterium sp. JCM 36343]|uniref:hypothetical protein n=1 Tax=Parasediminibacterium sp. JCM 36343 TaxID=3374279 RepID=UPI00397E5FF7
MVRTLVIPEQQNISLHLPQNFVGKKVEVIAFTVDETIEEMPLTYFASEKILAKDWLTPEEDKAWKDL